MEYWRRIWRRTSIPEATEAATAVSIATAQAPATFISTAILSAELIRSAFQQSVPVLLLAASYRRLLRRQPEAAGVRTVVQ